MGPFSCPLGPLEPFGCIPWEPFARSGLMAFGIFFLKLFHPCADNTDEGKGKSTADLRVATQKQAAGDNAPFKDIVVYNLKGWSRAARGFLQNRQDPQKQWVCLPEIDQQANSLSRGISTRPKGLGLAVVKTGYPPCGSKPHEGPSDGSTDSTTLSPGQGNG